jgi:hypothetical protein
VWPCSTALLAGAEGPPLAKLVPLQLHPGYRDEEASPDYNLAFKDPNKLPDVDDADGYDGPAGATKKARSKKGAAANKVGQCRSPASQPVLKAPTLLI